MSLAAGGARERRRGVVMPADFESGRVVLESYDPTQDEDPGAWDLTHSDTHKGSRYFLRPIDDTKRRPPNERGGALALHADRFGASRGLSRREGWPAMMSTGVDRGIVSLAAMGGRTHSETTAFVPDFFASGSMTAIPGRFR